MRRLEPATDWPDLSDRALTATTENWLAPHLTGMRRLSDLTRLDLTTVGVMDLFGRDRLNPLSLMREMLSSSFVVARTEVAARCRLRPRGRLMASESGADRDLPVQCLTVVVHDPFLVDHGLGRGAACRPPHRAAAHLRHVNLAGSVCIARRGRPPRHGRQRVVRVDASGGAHRHAVRRYLNAGLLLHFRR
jgi:hypothetical protein